MNSGVIPAAPCSLDCSLDRTLWHQALQHIIQQPPDTSQSVVVGAAAGILFGEGKLTEVELIRLVRGYLSGTSTQPAKSSGIIRGLLATAREVAWHVQEILRALDEQFGQWEEAQFLAALPDLRLAFADLSLQEITRIAESVANLHGAQELGPLVHLDLDATEVQFALQLSERVAAALQADGLD